MMTGEFISLCGRIPWTFNYWRLNNDWIFCSTLWRFLNETKFQQGSIVKGTVVAIENGFVLVDAGLKSESAIPAERFKNAAGELEVEVSAEVDVATDAVEDGFGELQLSRES